MRLRDIKTESDFFQFADVWYQRTHNLRFVWQNENESRLRRLKALYLWYIMQERVLHLKNIALSFHSYNP